MITESQLQIAREAAELTAAREDVRKAREGWEREVQRADDAEAAVGENCRTISRLEKELTAERSKVLQLESFAGQLSDCKEKLLTALAAMNYVLDKARAQLYAKQFMCPSIVVDNLSKIDLSLLHEHVRKKQQPLVDLLETVVELYPHLTNLADALAKVKQ